ASAPNAAIALAEHHVAVRHEPMLVRVEPRIVRENRQLARLQLDMADVVLSLLAVRHFLPHALDIFNRRRAGRRLRVRPYRLEQQQGRQPQRTPRTQRKTGENPPARSHVVRFEDYHGPPISFITSPSRKIDPATTTRGASRQAAASASAGAGSTCICDAGATRRAIARSSSGSAAP